MQAVSEQQPYFCQYLRVWQQSQNPVPVEKAKRNALPTSSMDSPLSRSRPQALAQATLPSPTACQRIITVSRTDFSLV